MFELNEKCGVFGVYGKDFTDVGRLAFNGLLALQHRGQESCGIAVSDGTNINLYGNSGLVMQVFNESVTAKLKGQVAVAHNRYSTSRGGGGRYIQPVMVAGGRMALVHNGNLPSTKDLEEFLNARGIKTEDHSDSELMAIALGECIKDGSAAEDAVFKVWPLFTGSFSLLLMSDGKLIALRDRCGIKPLSIGRLNGGYIVSSETCAFSGIGASFIRDVLPGEMVIIDDHGIRSVILTQGKERFDVFEFVYFASPASSFLGRSVYEARKKCGEELAKEYGVKADVVIPIPETAIPAAIGYSRGSGIPLEMGLIKNRYIQRTFIDPDVELRGRRVEMKLTPVLDVIKGKRVILIDDSIVRGTTSKRLIKKIFEAGAAEVHFLINSPPVRFPDFYGIDTPEQSQLLAFNRTVEEMNKFLGSTSLYFLSYDGLIRGIGVPEDKLCTSCFTGRYPIDIGEKKEKVEGAEIII